MLWVRIPLPPPKIMIRGECMKSKSDKKVNRLVKSLNRQIHTDVFGDRFSVLQVSKTGYYDCHDYHIYLYRFIDKKQPERNFEKLFSEGEILIQKALYIDMNEFIVSSDFWNTFDRESYFKNRAMCSNCSTYNHYNIKKIRLRAVNTNTGSGLDFIGEQAYCKKCNSMISQSYTEDILEKNKIRVYDINKNLNFNLIIPVQ